MMGERILIAGIGNIFLGDDAFGAEVAQRLARRSLPDGVRVVDYGIRGFDLAYAIESEDGHIGLSEPVQAAAVKAVGLIESLVGTILRERMTERV
jgi:hypothetical protein